MTFKYPEQYRITAQTQQQLHNSKLARFLSSPHGPGAFWYPHKANHRTVFLFMVATNRYGWEHVSVSVRRKWGLALQRPPHWEEMCLVKDLFWDPEDWVVQFHPAESEHIDMVNALHLWRSIDEAFPIPDSILVGLKSANAPR